MGKWKTCKLPEVSHEKLGGDEYPRGQAARENSKGRKEGMGFRDTED